MKQSLQLNFFCPKPIYETEFAVELFLSKTYIWKDVTTQIVNKRKKNPEMRPRLRGGAHAFVSLSIREDVGVAHALVVVMTEEIMSALVSFEWLRAFDYHVPYG